MNRGEVFHLRMKAPEEDAPFLFSVPTTVPSPRLIVGRRWKGHASGAVHACLSQRWHPDASVLQPRDK